MRRVRQVKVCPVCGSVDIVLPRGATHLLLQMPDSCEECGFLGTALLVDEDVLERTVNALRAARRGASPSPPGSR